jgi:hypothetical protein
VINKGKITIGNRFFRGDFVKKKGLLLDRMWEMFLLAPVRLGASQIFAGVNPPLSNFSLLHDASASASWRKGMWAVIYC